MSAVPAVRRMTPEEYFAWEETQEMKHEYWDGWVFPVHPMDETTGMAGATTDHVILVSNLTRVLGNALRGRGCLVLAADMRVALGEGRRYAYPDLAVVCGRPQFLTAKRTTLTNPDLVVEVLSPSTAEYDRSDKFAAYRRIPSLREYVLVAQDRRSVETFRKNDEGRWTLYETDPATGAVELASVGAALALDELYENVELPEGPPIPGRMDGGDAGAL